MRSREDIEAVVSRRGGFGEGPPPPKQRTALAWHKCEGYTAKVQGRRDTKQKKSEGLAWRSARAEAPVEGIRRRRTWSETEAQMSGQL